MKKLYACWGSTKETLVFQRLTDSEALDIDMQGAWFGFIPVESKEKFHETHEWDAKSRDYVERYK